MAFKIEILKAEIEHKDENAKKSFDRDANRIEHILWSTDKYSLLEILIKNQIQIDHSCGGHATCGTCQIELIEGELSEKEDLELEFATDRAMKENERLSCQSHPKSDLIIRIKNQTKT